MHSGDTRKPPQPGRRLVVGVGAGALVLAHTLEALLGHAWFTSYAYLLAVPVAIGAGVALAQRTSAGTTARRVAHWALISSSLLLLMLLPPFLEGEIATEGGLSPESLRDHALPAVLASVGAMYTIAVVDGALLLMEVIRRRR